MHFDLKLSSRNVLVLLNELQDDVECQILVKATGFVEEKFENFEREMKVLRKNEILREKDKNKGKKYF